MAKQKTKRAAQKRFSVSANGKVMRRPVKQAHFNGKATGNENRRKHGNDTISPSDERRVQALIPHAF